MNASRNACSTNPLPIAASLAPLVLAGCAAPTADPDAPTAPLSSSVVETSDHATVAGHVRVVGELPAPRVIELEPDMRDAGHSHLTLRDWEVSSAGGVAHCVVILEPLGDTPALDLIPGEVTLGKTGAEYLPRVLIAPAGGTLRHVNVDSPSHCFRTHAKKNRPVDLQVHAGEEHLQVLAHSEVIRVGANLRPYMTAHVYVTDEPLTTITDAEGAFRFDGVPPGRYRVETWHEHAKRTRTEIEVAAGAKPALELVLQPRPSR